MQAILQDFRNCNCYPSIRCSTIKTKNTFFQTSVQKTSLLPCLSLLHSTLFSFQGSLFQLLLQPDLKIRLSPGLQIQRQMSSALVGPSGLEPPTLRLSVVRSSQLSYGPVVDTSSISLAALYTARLVHFAASPLPRRPASLGSARILDDWLLFKWWR